MKLDCKHCGHSSDVSHFSGQPSVICPVCGVEVDAGSPTTAHAIPATPPELPPGTGRAKGKSRAIWYHLPLIVTLCAVVAFSISAYMIYVAPADAGKMDVAIPTAVGFVIGGMLVIVLMALLVAGPIAGVMAIFKKSFLRSLSVSYSLIAAVLVIMAMFGANFFPNGTNPRKLPGVAFLSDRMDQKRAVDELQTDLKSMLDESVGPDGIPRKIETRFDVNPAPKNDSERTVRMMRQYFNDVSEIQNQYIQSLEDDGLTVLLDAQRLSEDKDFSDSRETIAKAKKSVVAGRERNDEVMVNYPDRVAKEQLDSKLKKEIIDGFNDRMKDARPLYEELWDIEMKSIEHLEKMVDHIEATKGDWGVEDGMIAFQKNEDLETFNQILGQIDIGVKRQEEIRKLLLEKR